MLLSFAPKLHSSGGPLLLGPATSHYCWLYSPSDPTVSPWYANCFWFVNWLLFQQSGLLVDHGWSQFHSRTPFWKVNIDGRSPYLADPISLDRLPLDGAALGACSGSQARRGLLKHWLCQTHARLPAWGFSWSLSNNHIWLVGETYPSEKWWSSSVGMIIPNIWKNKKCSKPSARYAASIKKSRDWAMKNGELTNPEVDLINKSCDLAINHGVREHQGCFPVTKWHFTYILW